MLAYESECSLKSLLFSLSLFFLSKTCKRVFDKWLFRIFVIRTSSKTIGYITVSPRLFVSRLWGRVEGSFRFVSFKVRPIFDDVNTITVIALQVSYVSYVLRKLGWNSTNPFNLFTFAKLTRSYLVLRLRHLTERNTCHLIPSAVTSSTIIVYVTWCLFNRVNLSQYQLETGLQDHPLGKHGPKCGREGTGWERIFGDNHVGNIYVFRRV